MTAKDFRTWTGTVLALVALSECADADSGTAAQANIREATETVAAMLGNKPLICPNAASIPGSSTVICRAR